MREEKKRLEASQTITADKIDWDTYQKILLQSSVPELKVAEACNVNLDLIEKAELNNGMLPKQPQIYRFYAAYLVYILLQNNFSKEHLCAIWIAKMSGSGRLQLVMLIPKNAKICVA
ncbi:unnamed protein product [Amoebophrya sp. A120]|nr:unnamed protein product [Amoebophrya sp. A120]|eukprot:GSA120T00019537001.1